MLNLPHLEVPLNLCHDGAVCVKDTQIRLEQIIDDFEDGVIAEEIVARHKDLRLSDVYLVLSFYLKNRKDVEGYLARRHNPDSGMRVRPKPAA